MQSAEHLRYHIPNLKRALEVFEVLAKNTDGVSLTEIAKITGYSKNSIFRIICTLEDCGYVVKNRDQRKIRLSRKLAALGYAAFGESNIVERGMDIVRKMRDDLEETSMLGTMLEEDCVLLEQAPGIHPFKFLGEVGMRICFNASAPGKAMLAFLPQEERDRRLSSIKFKKFNSRTITDKKSFSEELEKSGLRGTPSITARKSRVSTASARPSSTPTATPSPQSGLRARASASTKTTSTKSAQR